MTPPTERQVLYALVAAAFLVVVAVLVVFAAASGLSPVWWTVVTATAVLAAMIYSGANWRATGRILGLSIGLFLIWTIGTLLTR